MDIVEHIDAATRICGDIGKTELEADEARYLAIMFCIVVVAEAAKELPDAMRVARSDVAWRNLISMGVNLKHRYFRVEADIVWDAVKMHFPVLRAAAEEMLEVEAT